MKPRVVLLGLYSLATPTVGRENAKRRPLSCVQRAHLCAVSADRWAALTVTVV